MQKFEQEPGQFWAFSLRLYAAPAIAADCLRLQNKYLLDVNLALYCCWCAQRSHFVTDKEIEAISVFSTQWRKQAVQPLRDIRTTLKGLELPPISASAIEDLRTDIKQAELQSEKIQQHALEGIHFKHYCDQRSENKTLSVSSNDISNLALKNLLNYFSFASAYSDQTCLDKPVTILEHLAKKTGSCEQAK